MVSITANEKVLIGQDGLYASAVTDKATNELIIKITNSIKEAHNIDLAMDGARKLKSKGFIDELENSNLKQLNSFEKPQTVGSKRTTILLKEKN